MSCSHLSSLPICKAVRPHCTSFKIAHSPPLVASSLITNFSECWSKHSASAPGLFWHLLSEQHISDSFNLACLLVFACPGADVQTGCGQDSPLHAAVRGGGADVVDLLLDFGADGCWRNTEGMTPLDLSLPNSAVRSALQNKGSLWTLTHVFCIKPQTR